MFRRHRASAPPPEPDDDEDEEEDAFSALTRRSKQKSGTNNNQNKRTDSSVNNIQHAPATQQQEPKQQQSDEPLVASTTSSMKRHHKEMSTGRKAKMDAMLQELQWEQQQEGDSANYSHSNNSNKRSRTSRGGGGERSMIAAGSGGSHVEPGQEHLTTNIFVGNLAPNITEEELSQLFGQFGDLYSVKIMWPRTAEERARQRLTGFVCFYHRLDAEEAMDACSEADPFRNGRRLMLRWGKNVLKEGIARAGRSRPSSSPAGAAADASLAPPPHRGDAKPSSAAPEPTSSSAPAVSTDGKVRIQVQVPSDPRRMQIISLVASFVAKDGADLEERLVSQNRSDLEFLMPNDQNEEHLFYKWRVYSYAQGDGEFIWRTEPFVMIHHSKTAGDSNSGCVWIPPPVDRDAALREEERRRREEHDRQRRRPPAGKRDARGPPGKAHGGSGGSGGQKQRALTRDELEEFHALTRKQLCASRTAIAQAMSFCFEKSHSASEISRLLKELLLEPHDGVSVSVDTRIARLYLLSDVLFNSQQPGVRNAFAYRNSIEQMAPEIFASLGSGSKDGSGAGGRLTHNKMAKAVSGVLAAWTNWSVYIPGFLDELQAHFEGRQVPKSTETAKEEEESKEVKHEDATNADDAEEEAQASTGPRGNWKEVGDDDDAIAREEEVPAVDAAQENTMVKEEPMGSGEDQQDGEGQGDGQVNKQIKQEQVDNGDLKNKQSNEKDDGDADADGEPLEDLDGEVLGDADGEPLEDPDGEPLENDEGEPLDDPDGEPLDDPDGEPL